MSSTREMVLRSWWAARRDADSSGGIILTAASFAGHVLEQAEGDVVAAHTLTPKSPVNYMARVHSYLDMVRDEEHKAQAERAASAPVGNSL